MLEELFLTTLTVIGYQDNFSLWPRSISDRFEELVRAATREEPEWTARFLRWLRTDTPMRYPALAGAAVFVNERRALGQHGESRQVVDSVLQRADDPGHMLARWVTNYGRAIPKPVKRGVADAVTRLYDERSLLAHDTGSHNFAITRFTRNALTLRGGIREDCPLRFGDVIELVHPTARDQQQADLFRYAIDRRHGGSGRIPASLPLVRHRSRLLDVPTGRRRALLAEPGFGAELAGAGVTWQILAGWLRRRLDRVAWEHLIPAMSLSDLLYHLRHFDQAGISFETAMAVAARLTDPAEIRAAGLLPLRFAAARRGVVHQRWARHLEEGAGHSVAAIPELPGRTLIVISDPDSGPESDTGVVFGLALAQRCATAEIRRADGHPFDTIPGESPLHGLIRWRFAGRPHPTQFDPRALGHASTGHDRIVLIDDLADYTVLPVDLPVYAWRTNPARWRANGTEDQFTPQTLVFHGLIDAAFTVIPLIENARNNRWPF
jgi:hypothetical protein